MRAAGPRVDYDDRTDCHKAADRALTRPAWQPNETGVPARERPIKKADGSINPSARSGYTASDGLSRLVGLVIGIQVLVLEFGKPLLGGLFCLAALFFWSKTNYIV